MLTNSDTRLLFYSFIEDFTYIDRWFIVLGDPWGLWPSGYSNTRFRKQSFWIYFCIWLSKYCLWGGSCLILIGLLSFCTWNYVFCAVQEAGSSIFWWCWQVMKNGYIATVTLFQSWLWCWYSFLFIIVSFSVASSGKVHIFWAIGGTLEY